MRENNVIVKTDMSKHFIFDILCYFFNGWDELKLIELLLLTYICGLISCYLCTIIYYLHIYSKQSYNSDY